MRTVGTTSGRFDTWSRTALLSLGIPATRSDYARIRETSKDILHSTHRYATVRCVPLRCNACVSGRSTSAMASIAGRYLDGVEYAVPCGGGRTPPTGEFHG